MLDIKGVCVSSGSACHNGIIEPSQVLKAVGLSNNEALGSLRISAGALTTEEECTSGAEILSRDLVVDQAQANKISSLNTDASSDSQKSTIGLALHRLMAMAVLAVALVC